MKTLMLLALVAAGFYFGPGVSEGTGAPCDALVMRALQLDPPKGDDGTQDRMTTGLARLFGPLFVEKVVEQRYPGVPPQIACAGLWWKSKTDPSILNFSHP